MVKMSGAELKERCLESSRPLGTGLLAERKLRFWKECQSAEDAELIDSFKKQITVTKESRLSDQAWQIHEFYKAQFDSIDKIDFQLGIKDNHIRFEHYGSRLLDRLFFIGIMNAHSLYCEHTGEISITTENWLYHATSVFAKWCENPFDAPRLGVSLDEGPVLGQNRFSPAKRARPDSDDEY
jgi:hypothetical protein